MSKPSKSITKSIRAEKNEGAKLMHKIDCWVKGKSPWFSEFDTHKKQMVKVKRPLFKNIKNPTHKVKPTV